MQAHEKILKLYESFRNTYNQLLIYSTFPKIILSYVKHEKGKFDDSKQISKQKH